MQGHAFTFEVEIGLPPGLPPAASALAEQAIRAGLDSVREQMIQAYGEGLETLSVELKEGPRPYPWVNIARLKPKGTGH